MKTSAAFALVLVAWIGAATPAVAQRLPFEQSFAVNEPLSLDVSTIGGKIDVTRASLAESSSLVLSRFA